MYASMCVNVYQWQACSACPQQQRRCNGRTTLLEKGFSNVQQASIWTSLTKCWQSGHSVRHLALRARLKWTAAILCLGQVADKQKLCIDVELHTWPWVSIVVFAYHLWSPQDRCIAYWQPPPSPFHGIVALCSSLAPYRLSRQVHPGFLLLRPLFCWRSYSHCTSPWCFCDAFQKVPVFSNAFC